MEVVVVLVVIGVIVLVAWPFLARSLRARNPRDQEPITDTDAHPPASPEEPVPGSRPHRERHGKP